MSGRGRTTYCVGSPTFRPDDLAQDKARQDLVRERLASNDLYNASRALFGLSERDDYTYHAMTSVKLAEAQRVVDLKGINGLHAWYRAEDGLPVRMAARAGCRPP